MFIAPRPWRGHRAYGACTPAVPSLGLLLALAALVALSHWPKGDPPPLPAHSLRGTAPSLEDGDGAGPAHP